MSILAGLGLVLSAAGTIGNWYNSDKQMEQNLLSNYYSYMQNLEGMKTNLGQTQTAINQNIEDIASNKYYLNAWKDQYDQSMQSATDEVYSQYQQMANNLGSGLVSTAETGKRGGSAGLINATNANEMKRLNGTTDGLSLTNNRLGAYLNTTALDMLADKQTAMAAVDVGYQSIGSYQQAIKDLTSSIAEMEGTTSDMKKKLVDKNLIKEAE